MKQVCRLFAIFATLLMLALPVHAQPPDAGFIYHVKSGDSLWKLAEEYLGDGALFPNILLYQSSQSTEKAILRPLEDPSQLRTGTALWIPQPIASLTVAPADTPFVTRPPSSGSSPAPTGHIAFSFWNDYQTRCTYEIDIIDVAACLQSTSACQDTRWILPFNNVSEPALMPDGTGITFRSWGRLSAGSPYGHCAPGYDKKLPQLAHTDIAGTVFTETRKFREEAQAGSRRFPIWFELDSHPDWSPDGTQLIFDSARVGDGINRLYTINKDGDVWRDLLIEGQQPSWAPDGYGFVYRGCDLTGNRCGLWVGNAYEPKIWERGANMVSPVVFGDKVAHPDWSPTDDMVVYQRFEQGSWNLWLVHADGRDDHPLTTSPNLEGLPVWSPDGQWIAYVSFDGATWQLRIINREGNDDRPLFTYDGGFYKVPKTIPPYYARDWLDEQISWAP